MNPPTKRSRVVMDRCRGALKWEDQTGRWRGEGKKEGIHRWTAKSKKHL